MAKIGVGNRSNVSLGIAVGLAVAVLAIGMVYFFGMFGLHNSIAQQVSMPSSQQEPLPVASRMFTNDTALIKRWIEAPYILDMAQLPKVAEVGKPIQFVYNFISSGNDTWLWHSDMSATITDSKGQPVLVLPNLHGHGSMLQFMYAFPSPGVYHINLLYGQQTGSPNFFLTPHAIRQAKFDVNVVAARPAPTIPQGAKVKEIPISVQSWAFTPNVINVNKGDVVKLDFTTAQDDANLYNGHGFGIDSYNVNVFLVKGANQSIEFVADKPGTYTFRCTSFCVEPGGLVAHHFDMTGQLVVHS
jgi:heme/copper-type cytochrome/quinol oxidase subunit 2